MTENLSKEIKRIAGEDMFKILNGYVSDAVGIGKLSAYNEAKKILDKLKKTASKKDRKIIEEFAEDLEKDFDFAHAFD